ncbi:MAG: hypothetical protein AAF492_03335 [Verrucomicrobiota bacterium]
METAAQSDLVPLLLLFLMMSTFIACIVVVPFWFIFSKAGYHGSLSVLMMLPMVNIALLFFLALTDWPIHKKLRAATEST